MQFFFLLGYQCTSSLVGVVPVSGIWSQVVVGCFFFPVVLLRSFGFFVVLVDEIFLLLGDGGTISFSSDSLEVLVDVFHVDWLYTGSSSSLEVDAHE